MVLAADRMGLRKNASSSPDTFANAALVSWPPCPHAVVTQDNSSATLESGEPTAVAGFSIIKTVWAKFVAPYSGTVNLGITAVGVMNGTIYAPFDALLAVYTGSAVNALTLVVGSDGDATCQFLSFTAVAGTTYHIQIGSFSSAPGTGGPFDLHVNINDDLANACDLGSALTGTVGPYFEGRIHFDVGEPAPAGYSGATVWYKKTIGGTGGAAQFDTIGSSVLPGGADSVMGVYTSSNPGAPTFANLTLVAANDQGGGNNDAQVNFTAVAGTVYFIQVMPKYNDPFGDASYKLNWSVPS